MKHRAVGREAVHDLGASAEGADRQAATDDLAERGEVGLDAVRACAPPRPTRKPVMTSSENQQRAVLSAGAQAREEARQRRHAVHVTRHRLDNDTGNFLAVRLECRAHRFKMVVLSSVSVSSASAFGTPGEDGTPSVSAEEPALTSSESPEP